MNENINQLNENFETYQEILKNDMDYQNKNITTSNEQTNYTLKTLASQGRGTNPVSSLNLISDGAGGAAKISMTTTATPTAGVSYQCSAIGIF